MAITRRGFLASGAAALAGAACVRQLWAADAAAPAPAGAGAAAGKIRVSARQFGTNLESAKKAGMDGVEVGVGGPADKLQIADAEFRAKIKDKVKETGVVVSSLSMDLLNGNPVATDEHGLAWLEQCIEAAKDLGAVAILVPFFGKAGLLKDKELNKDVVDPLVARLKEAGPKAKAAGVTLGLENTCSAKQNIEILDRVASDGVGVYYDIGNSTDGGYDVPAEIRELKARICMFHFKDGNNYLGEGKVKMEPIAEAIKAIDYKGWIILETACPSKDTEADCKRNTDFIRKLMGLTA
jgi:sugar phosphate isomerase/epimerase